MTFLWTDIKIEPGNENHGILGWETAETHGERLAISSKKNHHSFRIQKVMFTLQNEIHIACQLGWQDHTRSYKIPMSRCFKAMNNCFFGSLPMKGRPSSDLASSPRTQHLGFDPICHTLSSNCAWMLDIFWLVVLNMAQLTRPKTMESHHALHG